MNDATPKSHFPLLWTAGWQTVAVLLLWGLAREVLPLIFGHGASVRQAVDLGAVVVWGPALLSLLPVAVWVPRGALAALAAYLIGTVVRLVLCLLMLWWATHKGALPARPLAAVMGLTYLPLLLIEALMLSHFITQQQASRSPEDHPEENKD